MKETGTAARALINPTESEQKAETQIHRPSFRLISGLENTAVRKVDQEKLSKKDGKIHRSSGLVHGSTMGLFAIRTREDERLRAHWPVCFMLRVVVWSHDGNGRGWV